MPESLRMMNIPFKLIALMFLKWLLIALLIVVVVLWSQSGGDEFVPYCIFSLVIGTILFFCLRAEVKMESRE